VSSAVGEVDEGGFRHSDDVDNLLGEVEGSTSRSCDGLLFLREVDLYLRSMEDASSAELEEKVVHGVVEFARGIGARCLRRLGAMASKGLAVANVSFWVPQGGSNRVPYTLRLVGHGRRR